MYLITIDKPVPFALTDVAREWLFNTPPPDRPDQDGRPDDEPPLPADDDDDQGDEQ